MEATDTHVVMDLGDGLNACHAYCEHPSLDDCMLVMVGNRAAATAEFLNRRLALGTEGTRVPSDGDAIPIRVTEDQLKEEPLRSWVIDQTNRLNGELQKELRQDHDEGAPVHYYISPFSAYFNSPKRMPTSELGEDGAPRHLEMFLHGLYEEELIEFLEDEACDGHGPCIIVPAPVICVVMEAREEGSFPENLAWTAPRVLAMDSATRQFFDETRVKGPPQFVRGDKDRPWLVTHCKLAVPKEYFADYMANVKSLERPLLEAHIAHMQAGDVVVLRE